MESIIRARVPSSSLIALADARLALAQATDVSAVATLVDRLEVVRLAARKARLSLAAQNDWATLKLEAERKAGGMLTELRRAGELHAGRPNNADNASAWIEPLTSSRSLNAGAGPGPERRYRTTLTDDLLAVRRTDQEREVPRREAKPCALDEPGPPLRRIAATERVEPATHGGVDRNRSVEEIADVGDAECPRVSVWVPHEPNRLLLDRARQRGRRNDTHTRLIEADAIPRPDDLATTCCFAKDVPALVKQAADRLFCGRLLLV